MAAKYALGSIFTFDFTLLEMFWPIMQYLAPLLKYNNVIPDRAPSPSARLPRKLHKYEYAYISMPKNRYLSNKFDIHCNVMMQIRK